MNTQFFEDMYAMLWELIYKILAIFDIELEA